MNYRGTAEAKEIVARMRDRIARAKRIIALSHSAEIIALFTEMIAEAEADIRRMEDAEPKE